MKTWKVTDAAGKQHQVNADDIQGTDVVRFLSQKDAGGRRNLIAAFSRPIAVTEAVAAEAVPPLVCRECGNVTCVYPCEAEGS